MVTSRANCRLTMDESKTRFEWKHGLDSIVEPIADHLEGAQQD